MSAQAKLKLESIKMNNNLYRCSHINTQFLMSEYSYFINSRVRIIYGGFTKSLSPDMKLCVYQSIYECSFLLYVGRLNSKRGL